MLRHWDRLRDGVLGQFTPVAEDGSSRDWRPGHLCVTPEGQVQLKILLSEEDGHPMTVHPDAGHNVFVGLTEAGTVLVTRIRRWTTSPGYGTGCPVRRYEADVVLDEVDLELVEGDGVFGAQLHYYGLQDWTPGKTIVEPFDKIDSDLRWRLDVISLPEAATHLGERLQLSLSEAFVLGGQPDERRIGAPLRVKVEAAERRSLVDLLVVLDAVHALLVLAHPGEVRARAGFAKLGPEARWAGLWDADMMRHPTSEQPPAAGWTVVKLEDIGGSEGVAAWVRLCETHRRAVAPLVSHHLRHGQPPESRLMAVCAAIEYWVAANAREAWAVENKAQRRTKRNPVGETYAHALPRVVDAAWVEWIGDSDDWATRLWNRYEALKHNPATIFDPVELSALELGGRWLLTGALMDSCAGSSAPSRRMFGSRLWQAGRDIRQALFGGPE